MPGTTVPGTKIGPLRFWGVHGRQFLPSTHSLRITSTGCTRVARRAGTAEATSAAVTRAPATIHGSAPGTPDNSVVTEDRQPK